MLTLTTVSRAQIAKPRMSAPATDTAKRLSVPDSINASLLPVIVAPLPDTAAKISDSLALVTDSLTINDTAISDSLLSREELEDSLGIKISPDALPDIVTAEASDSAVMDMKRNIFDLYGNAKVNYQDMQLDAYKVSYDQSHNIVTAALSTDTAIQAKGRPSFVQGKEKFTYDSLQYNFKSKRAIVRNVRSQYGEGFVHSLQVKRNPDQSIYGMHNVYTTCALDNPHFGIAARKIKVVPGRVVASGSANFNIEGVPTPLFLPFGLFPVSEGQRSGFKIPTYIMEEQRGLGLVNGGYYFALSQKADLLIESSIYSKGSWSTNALTNYANRYKYSGAFVFKYAYNKTGEYFESNSSITKDFNVQWTHRSDPKSRPGVSFNASVDAGTSTYNANNTFTQNQILQNQYQSNITYTKQWANKPFSLSVSARHSQNTLTRLVNVTLPELTFTSQFNPFQGKNSTGEHWYEKINMQYNMSAVNQTSFIDSTFALSEIGNYNYQNGVLHTIPLSASYNIFRYVKMNPGINYREYWNTRQIYRFYNTQLSREDTILNRGFYTARDFDARVDFTTMLYGVKMFKKGKLAGIRHVLTPTAGIAYIPDYAAAPFNYGYRTRLSPTQPYTYLPVYEGAVPGVPGRNQFGDYNSSLNFGLNNNLQIKTRTDKDTTGFKNISIIDLLQITGSYNLAADSFNWGNFSTVFNTNLFKVVTITASALFDPYAYDYENGRPSKQTMLNAKGKLVQFRSATLSIGGSLNRGQQNGEQPVNPPPGAIDEATRIMQYGRYNDFTDFSMPFNMDFQYSLGISKEYSRTSKSDTFVVAQHYIGVGGFVNITPRWRVDVRTGFDMISKSLQLTTLELTRDLHCMEMHLTSVPFGPRKSYYFTLRIKAQVLSDLKLTRQRNFRDALQ